MNSPVERVRPIASRIQFDGEYILIVWDSEFPEDTEEYGAERSVAVPIIAASIFEHMNNRLQRRPPIGGVEAFEAVINEIRKVDGLSFFACYRAAADKVCRLAYSAGMSRRDAYSELLTYISDGGVPTVPAEHVRWIRVSLP